MDNETEIKTILIKMAEAHEDMLSGQKGMGWLNEKKILKSQLINLGVLEKDAENAFLYPIHALCNFLNIPLQDYYINRFIVKHKDYFLKLGNSCSKNKTIS